MLASDDAKLAADPLFSEPVDDPIRFMMRLDCAGSASDAYGSGGRAYSEWGCGGGGFNGDAPGGIDNVPCCCCGCCC